MGKKSIRYCLCILSFLFIFCFFSKNILAIGNNELPQLCSGGKYDYCSQAPKCGEYPEINNAWLEQSSKIWNSEINEFCAYKFCEGYVPLCCYEMVRTKDKDMCWGYNTLYCLPSQCTQVPGSGEKNCAHWIKTKCSNSENLQPVPLSSRFQNDSLFLLIDSNPNSSLVKQLPTKYPDLWNKYLAWKNNTGSPTPSPTPLLTQTPTPTPTITLTPIPSNTPLPTQSENCICQTDATCSSKCQFEKYPEGTYFSPIKCSFQSSYYLETPNQETKDTWCNRGKRSMGDVDGDGTVNTLDYFYFIRSVYGGKIPNYVNPDINGDGTVAEADLDIILKSLTGIWYNR